MCRKREFVNSINSGKNFTILTSTEMNFKFVFILFLFLSFFSKGQEIEIDKNESVIYKDSLGNYLTFKQASDLLKTGKYVSVPSMNSSMKIEQTIRKSAKEDKERYKTYTDGSVIISTTGLKTDILKYNLGDTLPVFNVMSYKNGNHSSQELIEENKLLIFYEDNNSSWRDVVSHIKLFVEDYPNISYIISTSNSRLEITDLFDRNFLAKHNNIFLASNEVIKQFSIKTYPWFLVINREGKLLLFVPPLPNSGIAINALKKFLAKIYK